GTIFGAPTELALKVAYLFTSMVPNAEMVRFTNTGSEATMHAIRIARAHTGRDKIIKFEGAYHGTHDYVLTGLFPFLGLEHHPIHAPFSPGVPSETLKSVILATWNDVQLLEKIVKDHQGEIAAIITEPLMASAACIMPEEGYLQAIRELCDDHGIVFILDEVMTGFRLAPGGAQEYFGVDADLATFAKILGGGLPVAAVAGKGEFMEHVGPGRIFFAGTFNGNPLGLAASRAVLSILRDNRPLYSSIFKTAETLISGIQEILERAGERVLLQGPGPMFQLCFTELERITKVRQLALVDKEKYRDLVWSLFSRGVYAHPLFAERWMLSAAHTSEDIDLTLAAFEDVARSELSGKE
ncbi:MAG: aspartate aminotransferase family protein, partial [Thermoplasmata archaeon]